MKASIDSSKAFMPSNDASSAPVCFDTTLPAGMPPVTVISTTSGSSSRTNSVRTRRSQLRTSRCRPARPRRHHRMISRTLDLPASFFPVEARHHTPGPGSQWKRKGMSGASGCWPSGAGRMPSKSTAVTRIR